ncbi:MAG: hypothetical protein ABTQ34_05930 [Bdellovibrionales bacterium]
MSIFAPDTNLIAVDKAREFLLAPAAEAIDHPIIQRLYFGLAKLGCKATAKKVERDTGEAPKKPVVPLMSILRCVEPSCDTSSIFAIGLKEAQSEAYAGLIIPRFNSKGSEPPHPYYAHLDLYLRHMRSPENMGYYGAYGQPSIVLFSHNDCYMAKVLASDPVSWGNRPLDQVAKANREFRDAVLTAYESSAARNKVQFHDYLAVAIARRTALYVTEALAYFCDLDPNLQKPVVIPIHSDMLGGYCLIDPTHDHTLMKVMDASATTCGCRGEKANAA